jgi:hypothetical protein
MSIKLAWGLPLPDFKIASAWGASAIFKPGSHTPIDILGDRLDVQPEGVESPMLCNWLWQHGLPWLNAAATDLEPGDCEVVELTRSPFGVRASPNGSHGYIYICAWRQNLAVSRYELPEPPEGAKWSGRGAPPKKGARVVVGLNRLGPGEVVDYFAEHGYLGVRVRLDDQPKWHQDQNGKWPYALVFGAEIS